MTAVRTLIVDDEKPGRERLRRLVLADARLELAGCCSGGAEALTALKEAEGGGRPVRLLMLDVQMPEVDGFSVIAALVRQTRVEDLPAIVFVTAHDEYALRAFDAHAVDYLLKPFSDERFQAAIDRALRFVNAGDAHALISRMQALLRGTGRHDTADGAAPEPGARRPLDRIVIKAANRVRLVPVDQISWIEADGMYVKLHMRDGSVHQQRGLLGGFESSLDERCFVRIHRSAIVNIDVVQELRQDAHGEYIAVLRDRSEVRVGRRFRARLQARLGQAL